MKKDVYRCLRRATTVIGEQRNFELFFELNFNQTIEEKEGTLSTYMLTEVPHLQVRAMTEHAAAANMQPPARIIFYMFENAMLEGDLKLIMSPGNVYFKFTKMRHRDLMLCDLTYKREIAEYIYENFDNNHIRKGGEIKRYARSMKSDPEWLEFYPKVEYGIKWQKI